MASISRIDESRRVTQIKEEIDSFNELFAPEEMAKLKIKKIEVSDPNIGTHDLNALRAYHGKWIGQLAQMREERLVKILEGRSYILDSAKRAKLPRGMTLGSSRAHYQAVQNECNRLSARDDLVSYKKIEFQAQVITYPPERYALLTDLAREGLPSPQECQELIGDLEQFPHEQIVVTDEVLSLSRLPVLTEVLLGESTAAPLPEALTLKHPSELTELGLSENLDPMLSEYGVHAYLIHRLSTLVAPEVALFSANEALRRHGMIPSLDEADLGDIEQISGKIKEKIEKGLARLPEEEKRAQEKGFRDLLCAAVETFAEGRFPATAYQDWITRRSI